MPADISPKPRKKPVRKRPKLELPNPIDVHVGKRVRLRRTLLGLSQEKLGEKIGLTFQQVQKYERGANRISASRLWELSTVLDVPVEFFYSEISSETKQAASRIASVADGFSEGPAMPYEADPATKRQSLELVRAYLKINPPHIRKRVFELTKALASLNDTDDGGGEDDEQD